MQSGANPAGRGGKELSGASPAGGRRQAQGVGRVRLVAPISGICVEFHVNHAPYRSQVDQATRKLLGAVGDEE